MPKITTPAIAVATEPPATTRRGLLDLVGRALAVAWVATFLGGCIWLVVTVAPGADLTSWLLILVLVPAWLGISIVPFGAIGLSVFAIDLYFTQPQPFAAPATSMTSAFCSPSATRGSGSCRR